MSIKPEACGCGLPPYSPVHLTTAPGGHKYNPSRDTGGRVMEAGSPEAAAEIVRALADRDPSDGEGYACGLCRRPLGLHGGDDEDPANHAELCLWVLARDWVAEHPEGA